MATKRLAGLGIPLGKKVGKLSGGQQAQVALTLALAKRPDLLLLDEPVASLDPLARREFLQVLMEAVADDGITVILSSHIVAELERVCDYLVILAAGGVQLAGPIEELLRSHHVLTGPRGDAGAVARTHAIVQERHTARQTRCSCGVTARSPIRRGAATRSRSRRSSSRTWASRHERAAPEAALELAS